MATLSSAFEEIYATAQILHAERRNHAQRASPSTCGNTVLTLHSKDRKVAMHHFNDNAFPEVAKAMAEQWLPLI